MSLKAGESFPSTVFVYVPYAAESADIIACGNPIPYDTSKHFEGKKVVVVAAPGAFTPTCTANHIPPFISQVEKFKAAGVDQIVVLTANDPFVNNAWGKALKGIHPDNYIIFASDPNAKFSQSVGRSLDLTEKGLGIRTSRYAIIVDNNKVVYNEQESGPAVEASSAETVLSKL